MSVFKKIGKFFKKVFDPSSWFKMPEIQLPPMPAPAAMAVAPPDAPKAAMVDPAERAEVAGASRKKSGLSLFSKNLTPMLNQLIGLGSTNMPAGMLIPGQRGGNQ